MKQFVIDSDPVRDGKIVVSGRDFHYLIRVRRYRVGSEFPVIDREGRHGVATVTVVADGECVLSLATAAAETPTGAQPPSTELRLVQCLPKAKKMDTIVRQAAEAGVARVMPAVSRYCVSRPEEEAAASKVQRWRQIAREAVQQSGSATATEVDEARPLAAVVGAAADCDCRLFFHHLPLPERVRLHEAVPGASKIAFLIGPEGGLSEDETDMLLQNGWRPVYLGKNILRCETAPLYAAAAINIILEECRK